MPPTVTNRIREKVHVRRLRRAAHAAVQLGEPFRDDARAIAELALLRALTLEKELRVASLFRNRESVAAMARSVVESVLRGLYVLSDPASGRGRLQVEAQGHMGKMSMLGDASFGRLLRDAAAMRRQDLHRGMPDLRQVAEAVDNYHQIEVFPDHRLGQYLYHDWYLPLSNLAVHPSLSALSRYYRFRTHVVRRRPWGFVPRRGAIRMADGSIAHLVIALNEEASADTQWLARYASRQLRTANVPLAILVARVAVGQGPRVLVRTGLAAFRHRDALSEAAPRQKRSEAIRAVQRAANPGATDEELDQLAAMFVDELDRHAEASPDRTDPSLA